MDRIHLRNLAFFAYHGALHEESRLGQRFFVDLSLGLDLRPAGESDDLSRTVSYEAVYRTVRECMENSRFSLIEALAETICREIFKRFPAVAEVHILLKKPSAPVEGIFDYMGVELTRKR